MRRKTAPLPTIPWGGAAVSRLTSYGTPVLDPPADVRISSEWWLFRLFPQTVMPKYEYKCASCGNQFSRVESLSEHAERPVTCPECSSTEVERVFPEFFAKTIRKS